MTNYIEEALISRLPTDLRLKLSQIIDPDQRSLLLDCLRSGVEIPEFAWQPIRNFSEKLGALEHDLESSDFCPSGYWSSNGEPITCSHTNLRDVRYFDVGEDLPKLRRQEVEIARITLGSTLADVISVRAQRKGDDIAYRVVDEYGTLFKVKPVTSKEPLSLAQLLNLLEQLRIDGDTASYLPGLAGDDPDFLSAHSDFYPGLNSCFKQIIAEWIKD